MEKFKIWFKCLVSGHDWDFYAGYDRIHYNAVCRRCGITGHDWLRRL